ncbi:MAG: Gfo/Idh/MocA family protein, partial [Trueperaceae bacterium]
RLDVAYERFEDILADDAIDVVHVASPNDTHLRYAKAALEAGKHVVCEKPLALGSDETRELLRVAGARPHLVAAVNYNVRYYPMALQ